MWIERGGYPSASHMRFQGDLVRQLYVQKSGVGKKFQDVGAKIFDTTGVS